MKFFDFGADLGDRRFGGTHGRKSSLVPLIGDASFEPGDNPKSALLGLAGDVFRTLPRLHLREALLLLGFGRLALTVAEGFEFTLRGVRRFPCCCGFLRVGVALGSQSLNAGATPTSWLLLLLPLLTRLVLGTLKVCIVLILEIKVVVDGVKVVAAVEGQVIVHCLLLANSVGKTRG